MVRLYQFKLFVRLELGATEVQAWADRKLMVEQVNCRWKVRAPHLAPLRDRPWGC